MIKPRLKNILFVLIVFLCSYLIVLLNFQGLYFAGGDQSNYTNPAALLDDVVTSWDRNNNYIMGGKTVSMHFIMPLALFYRAFDFINILNVQYLYFSLVFSGIFLSAYFYFYKFLFKKAFPSLLSSALYLFNLFFFVSYVNFNIHLSFILFPLFLILCHYIYERQYIQIALVTVVISFLFPAAFINPPAILPLVFCAFLYYVYLGLFQRGFGYSIKVFKASIFGAALLLFLNIWWFYSFVSEMLSSRVTSSLGTITFHLFRTTSLFDAFRFLGGWAYNPADLSFDVGRYDALYYNPLFIILSYIPILAAYFVVLFKKKDRNVIFFFALSLFGMFLAKGELPPFGALYNWIFRHVPGFFMFREPYTKFMTIHVLGIAALLGFFAGDIKQVIEDRVYRFLKILVIVSIVITTIPFIVGGFIPMRDYKSQCRSYLIEPPDYIRQYKSLTEQNNLDYRVLITPQVTTSFLWEHGANISNMSLKGFSTKPLITYRVDYLTKGSVGYIDPLYQTLKRGDSNFLTLLGILNVGEIYQQNDADWRYIGNIKVLMPPSRAEEMLNSFGLEKTGSLGSFTKEYLGSIPNKEEVDDTRNMLYAELLGRSGIDIYGVPERYFLPHLYVPKRTLYVSGKVQALSDMTAMTAGEPRTQLFFRESNMDSNALDAAAQVFVYGNRTSSDSRLSELFWGRDWLWPDPSFSPTSPLYRLVIMKERSLIERANDERALMEQLAWLSSKKVAEIKKFKVSREFDQEVLSKYIEYSQLLVEHLKNFDLSEPDSADIIKKSYMYLARSVLILVGELGYSTKDIGTAFSDLQSWVGNIQEESEGSCKYIFSVPKEGNYKIYNSAVPSDEGYIETVDIQSSEHPNIEDDLEVELPDPSISPNSFKYPLVLFKEKLILLRANGDSQRLEALLWLSAKKVAELDKFDGVGSSKVLAVLSEYLKSLDAALVEYRREAEDEEYFKFVNKYVSYLSIFSQSISSESSLGKFITERHTVLAGEYSTYRLAQEKALKNPIEYEVPCDIEPSEAPIFTLDSYINNGAGYFIQLPEWEPASEYVLSFEYKVRDMDLVVNVLENRKDYSVIGSKQGDVNWDIVEAGNYPYKRVKVLDKNLANSQTCVSDNLDCFSKFEAVFYSSALSEGAFFSIQAPQELVSSAYAEIKDLKLSLRKIPTLVMVGEEFEETSLASVPKISFKKINNSKYEVNVKGASEPYNLIFSESYHPDWNLYLLGDNVRGGNLWGILGRSLSYMLSWKDRKALPGSSRTYFDGDITEGPHFNSLVDSRTFETWGLEPIAGKTHAQVNSYANVWTISPRDVNGKEDYSMILEFGSQRPVLISQTISFVSLVLTAVFVSISVLSRFLRAKRSKDETV
jgi:hypothetical protein